MAEEPEVSKETPAKEAGEKKAGPVTPGKGGSSDYFKKHKGPILAIGAGILIAAYFLLRNKGTSASTAQAATPAAGIDPATGYQYGSPADLAALGASGSQGSTPGSPSVSGNIDPLTGFTYGSPQDTQALQAMYSTPLSSGAGTSAGTISNSGTMGTQSPALITGSPFTSNGITYPAGSSVAQFQQAFAATGQNAGTIVPGGTGKPIPLPKGKSYTK